MTDHLITVPAASMTGAKFARSLGLRIRTPEQKAAEWRAECERYADMIENGSEWAVSPPYLWDARRIVEERAQQQIVDVEHLGPGRIAA